MELYKTSLDFHAYSNDAFSSPSRSIPQNCCDSVVSISSTNNSEFRELYRLVNTIFPSDTFSPQPSILISIAERFLHLFSPKSIIDPVLLHDSTFPLFFITSFINHQFSSFSVIFLQAITCICFHQFTFDFSSFFDFLLSSPLFFSHDHSSFFLNILNIFLFDHPETLSFQFIPLITQLLNVSSHHDEIQLCSEYVYTVIYFIDNRSIQIDESDISLFHEVYLALFHHLNQATIFVLKPINLAMIVFPIREDVSCAGLEPKLVELFSQTNGKNLSLLFDASSQLLVALHPNLPMNLFSSEFFMDALSSGLLSEKRTLSSCLHLFGSLFSFEDLHFAREEWILKIIDLFLSSSIDQCSSSFYAVLTFLHSFEYSYIEGFISEELLIRIFDYGCCFEEYHEACLELFQHLFPISPEIEQLFLSLSEESL
jgi:hypothetical protein